MRSEGVRAHAYWDRQGGFAGVQPVQAHRDPLQARGSAAILEFQITFD